MFIRMYQVIHDKGMTTGFTLLSKIKQGGPYGFVWPEDCVPFQGTCLAMQLTGVGSGVGAAVAALFGVGACQEICHASFVYHICTQAGGARLQNTSPKTHWSGLCCWSRCWLNCWRRCRGLSQHDVRHLPLRLSSQHTSKLQTYMNIIPLKACHAYSLV